MREREMERGREKVCDINSVMKKMGVGGGGGRKWERARESLPCIESKGEGGGKKSGRESLRERYESA